jgi:hypothetical protein
MPRNPDKDATNRRSSVRAWSWISSLGIAGVALISIWRTIRADGLSGDATGYVFGFLAVLVLWGLLGLSNWVRLRRVRSISPKAFVVNISIFLDLEPQLEEVQQLLPRTRRSGKNAGIHYATLAVDRDSLRIFRGWFKAKEEFRAPSSALSEVRVVRAPQGTFNLHCIQFAFTNDEKSAHVDIAVLRPQFGLLVVESKTNLDRSLDAIIQASGTQ